MNWDTYKYLHKEYVVNGRSTGSIAKEHSDNERKLFPNTIRRALKKHQIDLRTKSSAQKNYLSSNPHPMEGRERTEEERRKISQGIQKWWDDLTPTEHANLKAAMAERAGEKWDRMTTKEKKKSISKMHAASREKAGCGGKNENKVAELLKFAGYKIIQRTKDFSPRNMFEIDICIPSLSAAIEWDGLAHFKPIYGKKNLNRTMEKDSRKNKSLTKDGWVVIRCRDHSTSHSVAFCQRAVNQIIKLLKIKLKPGVYYIEAE